MEEFRPARVVINDDDKNSSTPSKSDGDTLSTYTGTASRSGSYWSINYSKLNKPKIPPIPLNLVFAMGIFSMTSYVIDVATDILLVYSYYSQGGVKEGSLTLVFVLLPCVGVLMDKFYRDSFLQTCTLSKERMREVLIGIRDALFIFFSTVKIYCLIIYHSWTGYWNKTKRKEHRSELEKLQNDAYGIRFYESTFEALPQLILQTILTLEDINERQTQPLGSEILRLLTIISSLVSISWGISSYVSRSPAVITNPFTCYQMTFLEKMLNFLAHVCVLAANVLALGLSCFGEKYIIIAVFAVRTFVMVTYRKCDKEKKVIKNFSQFSLVMVGICVPSDDGAFNYTYKSYILVFLCDFIANSVFVAFWYEEHKFPVVYQFAFVISHYVALMVGMLLMFLFYWRRSANIMVRRKSIFILSPVAEDDLEKEATSSDV